MADDVLAVVDVLATEPLFAFGHSMGGCALVLAEVARPGRFTGLYLYEPVLIPARTYPASIDGNPMASAASRRRLVFGSRVAAFENYASKPPLNELREDALRAYVEHGFRERDDGTVELKCAPADEAETFTFGATSGAFERLGDEGGPVTIARGVADSFGPADYCEAQVEALPAGRLVTFGDLGHFGPLQDPLAAAPLGRVAAPSQCESTSGTFYFWVDREQAVELTRVEFALLVALAREPTRVFTKRELLRDVWGYRSLGRTRTLDTHACRLRRKLESAGSPRRSFVVALWGVGYSLIRP